MEHQLERRYKTALFELKAALGLCAVAVPIPPHLVVCKAVALLRYQFSQIQKEDGKQSRTTSWDHPKYGTATKTGANSGSSNHIAQHHDTRQFYANSARRPTVNFNPNGSAARFCPTIGGAVGVTVAPNVTDSSMPPIDWGSDDGLDTIEIDSKLKTETEQKLGIKAENESTAETTNEFSNEFSNEWDEDHFGTFDDDIDFDVPLQMDFQSQFL